jgi:hypothetical protein
MYEQKSIHNNDSRAPGHTTLNEDPFLTESEAAAYLRVALVTLRRRRYSGTGPRYIRIGEISYRRSWLEDFIRQTSEPHADSRCVGNGAE